MIKMFYAQHIVLVRHVDSTIYTLSDQVLGVVLCVSSECVIEYPCAANPTKQ